MPEVNLYKVFEKKVLNSPTSAIIFKLTADLLDAEKVILYILHFPLSSTIDFYYRDITEEGVVGHLGLKRKVLLIDLV
jgi:hypothetical protein